MQNKLVEWARRTARKLPDYYLDHTTISKWPQSIRVKRAINYYEWSTGRKMDINNPKTFPEKINWYKLFYSSDEMSRIVDKIKFKSYIEEKLGPGHTIPMFGAWKTVEEFRRDWDGLPEEFCLKSNLQSAGNGIRMIHHKSEEDLEDVCGFVAHFLEPRNTLINSYCKAYYTCSPMMFAEEFVTQVDGQLYDYKIFCFDGEPYCFYVATDHFTGGFNDITVTFYDLDWNRIDARYGEHPNCDVERPTHFDEMMEYAKILSKGFPFVRVDFFDTAEKLYLAELTFYPGGGDTLYKPEEFNRELGDRFHLPGKEC